MAPSRIRYSVEHVQNLYDTGEDRSKLENLIRAFRGIQALHSDESNSFFRIAGYHGEPFHAGSESDPHWWGGYCWHGTALFPTWHRAYVLRLENALRSIPGCQDVTLPFWDQLANVGVKPPKPIPSIFTSPRFELDGRTDNPLYSYKLQEALVYKAKDKKERYTKPVDYETVRYPLSGLVGTDDDKTKTKIHNEAYKDPVKNTEILNANVANWLEGTIEITPDDKKHSTRMPDTYSIHQRYASCLQAPNYTVFSNTTSQNQWIKDAGQNPASHSIVSLENPHNAMHLALGGFYQKGKYNADPIIGANGDMGDNETAAFDPIFYFHHCFIDYVFATYQKINGLDRRGGLTLIKNYRGTILKEGQPNCPPETVIHMTTALIPFEKPGGGYYDSNDMTDYENDLDYTYDVGSLDPFRTQTDTSTRAPFVQTMRVHNIDRTNYQGSFVIRLYARGPGTNGKEVEVGREPVLSRWSVQGCRHCLSHQDVEAFVPIDETLLKALQGGGQKKDIKWWAEVQTRDRLRALPGTIASPGEGPQVVELARVRSVFDMAT